MIHQTGTLQRMVFGEYDGRRSARAEELLAYRLSSLHNVTYTQDLMRRLRLGLADGSFGTLRDAVTAHYGGTGTRTDKRALTGR